MRNAQAIKELTQAIAYQVGSEVNENELSNRLKIDRKPYFHTWTYSKNHLSSEESIPFPETQGAK